MIDCNVSITKKYPILLPSLSVHFCVTCDLNIRSSVEVFKVFFAHNKLLFTTLSDLGVNSMRETVSQLLLSAN